MLQHYLYYQLHLQSCFIKEDEIQRKKLKTPKKLNRWVKNVHELNQPTKDSLN